MNLKSKFFSYLLILTVLFQSFSVGMVFAQEDFEEPDNPFEDGVVFDDGSVVDPQLFVDYIDLGDDTYNIGGEIFGSFVIYNNGITAAPDVKYRVEFVELIATEEFYYPTVALDTSDISESFSIDGTSAIQIDFNYSIPENVPEGTMGIFIQAYLADKPTASEFVVIDLNGERRQSLDVGALIVINDNEEYQALEGPVVEDDETVSLDVSINNTTDTDAELLPKVYLYAGNDINTEPFREITLDPITIPQNSSLDQSYDLPVSEVDPGVYTVVVEYETLIGPVYIQPIQARYITGGLNPKIDEIIFNTTDMNSAAETGNGLFVVTVSYGDVPFNIRVDENGNSLDPRFNEIFDPIEIENEDGTTEEGYQIKELEPLPNMAFEIVIKDSFSGKELEREYIEFGDSSSASVGFDSNIKAREIDVEVSLYQDGEEIDKEVVEVEIIPRFFDFLSFLYENRMIAGVALLIIMIILFYLLTHSNKKDIKNKIKDITV